MSATPRTGLSTLMAAPTPPGRPIGLSAQELRRRVWHMGPGLLPFLLWPIPHRDPISPTLWWIILAIAAGLSAALFANWRRVARTGVGDADRIAAIAGYAGSVLATLLLFPAHAECGLAVLAVLAFGDGSATLFGRLAGGPRLPWNRAKSVAGLLGFVAVGLPAAAVVYWGESRNAEAVGPAATAAEALIVAAAGVVAGAVAESIPSRINDNVRVGVAAAVAIVAAHGLLFGL